MLKAYRQDGTPVTVGGMNTKRGTTLAMWSHLGDVLLLDSDRYIELSKAGQIWIDQPHRNYVHDVDARLYTAEFWEDLQEDRREKAQLRRERLEKAGL